MATLTADMKTFIENNLAWITTVDKDGNLDLGPKMSMFVLDDNHLAYHERTAGQHYRNLQDGSPLVVAVANLAEKKGYRFRGTVTLHTDDDIYDAQVKVAEEKGTKKPAAIPVLEIRDPGPVLRRHRRQDHRQGLTVDRCRSSARTDDRHVTRKARFGRCMPEPRLFWSFDTGFRATLSAAAGSGTATEGRRRLDVSGCGNDAPAA